MNNENEKRNKQSVPREEMKSRIEYGIRRNKSEIGKPEKNKRNDKHSRFNFFYDKHNGKYSYNRICRQQYMKIVPWQWTKQENYWIKERFDYHLYYAGVLKFRLQNSKPVDRNDVEIKIFKRNKHKNP